MLERRFLIQLLILDGAALKRFLMADQAVFGVLVQAKVLLAEVERLRDAQTLIPFVIDGFSLDAGSHLA